MQCTNVDRRIQAMTALKQRAPDIGRAFAPFFQALMKEGSLSVKQKELIALGIGVALRCDGCIDAHVEKSLRAGATEEEILEATGVAVMMGGGPAYTTAPSVVTALERLNTRTDTSRP
jgi:AhpD family alkylhydroperoxidase